MRPLALTIASAFALLLADCRFFSDNPSPEVVVRRWQDYIDRNKFDSARLYSTELARSYVDFIDAITQGDTSEITQTLLFDMGCDIMGDSAICHFLIEGEMGEKIPDTLILYKVKGRWLVHRVEGFTVIPVDTLQPGDDQILFPGDSFDVEYE